MACGCAGGSNGGGCGGGHEHPAKAHKAPVMQPEIVESEQDAVPAELIVSSEQEWPRIKVNAVAIAPEAIAQELQYHPAQSRDEAVYLASQALVIRELLQQRINALDLKVRPSTGESEEEAATRELVEREVPMPRADEPACRQYFDNNRERFASAPLLAARHILLACPADDPEERSRTREQAEALLEQLKADISCFTELAQAHSACPSKDMGGALGQLSKGQTVPEFERQLFRLPVGLASRPLESRYGYHLVHVDQRVEGELLPYEAVAGSIRAELDQRVWQTAVAQYLKNLVGAAAIEGIHLQGAESPLMQ